MADLIKKVVLGAIVFWFVYLLVVLMASAKFCDPYMPDRLDKNASDQERATVLATAVTHALEEELDDGFGWLPNDLFFIPSLVDNRTSFQRGVIYAVRPASDMIAKTAARYGAADTIDPRLADATSRYFTYADNVWGWFLIYDTEGKYQAGIKNWRNWAQSVGSGDKKAGIYNVKSDDVYQILKYCDNMTDYVLGLLNDETIGHFSSDNVSYYAKGVCRVVGDVLRAINAVDSTLLERGGEENVAEALKQFAFIDEFNPLYVFAGGNEIGDAMMPNHVAALARHANIANNRINDMMASMEK